MGVEDTPEKSELLPLVTNPDILQQAILYKINTRVAARGEVAFPCVPGMEENYLQWLEKLFNAFGRPLPAEKQLELRQLLAIKLTDGFQASAAAVLLVQYELAQAPATGVSCKLVVATPTVGEQYNTWVQMREPPLFGSYPDAKVMSVAAKLGNPQQIRVLDVGAGPGRNTLPLARQGHAVDAIELTPAFVEQLRADIEAQQLPVTVIQGDILDPLVRMRPSHYQLAIAVELISHFRGIDQVRLFLAKMCDFLCPGGVLLFSTFLATEGYEPNALVRTIAEMSWSTLFTRQEMAEAMDGLPLVQISDELVYEYERQHLPPEAWPPTGWFSSWAMGQDVFPMANARPPMELRWIVCRRR